MAEEITILTREKQHTICISDTVGTFKLGKIMGPAYEEIYSTITGQNIELDENNVPFTIYNDLDWSRINQSGFFAMIYLLFFHQWKIDMGIPCPESVKVQRRQKSLSIEAGKFLQTLHIGPYQKVGDTYKKMIAYANQENLSIKNKSIEFYRNDPRYTPQSELKTEVLIPLLENG